MRFTIYNMNIWIYFAIQYPDLPKTTIIIYISRRSVIRKSDSINKSNNIRSRPIPIDLIILIIPPYTVRRNSFLRFCFQFSVHQLRHYSVTHFLIYRNNLFDHIHNLNRISDRNRSLSNQLPGITFDRNREYWPPPHIQTVEGVGSVREQKGEVVIRVPFTIDPEDAEPGPVRLRTLFRYRTCKDEGACFMPMLAAADATFEIVAAGEPALAGTDPILADLKPLDELLSKPPAAAGQKYSLPMIFLFAFLGGLILNIMPCVLPVISLKIFSFV